MKITYILPAIGKKKGEKYIGTWKMEPLTIAVLKGVTPSDIETEFFDDRIELINYDTETDLVVITVETYTALRSYQIAEQFKKRGKKVIAGGYHITLFPEEGEEKFDHIITGNGEVIWKEVMEDLKRGELKKRYDGKNGATDVMPDRTIFKGKNYLPVSLVETGRGCIHKCEFCSIAKYYNCSYFKRDIDSIIEDMKSCSNKYFFMVDDNLVADIENAKELFRRMIPLKVKWAGQGTLTMAKDRELLKLMKKSGCELILIGFESLEESSLEQMKKSWNGELDTDKLVREIHRAGIGIYATFVLGYDGDTKNSITKTVEFAKKHNFYTAAFNHLLPFPGTELYARLKEENRLIYDRWWLEESYRYGELSFHPKNMSAEEMAKSARDARKEFAKFGTVLKRGAANMYRTSPVMWPLFWAMNLRLGEEIDEKMNVPLGGNLDELPK